MGESVPWTVAKYAAGSRLLVIALQFLFNYFIPDHQADAFRSPLIASEKKQWSTLDVVVQKFFEGFTRWDSQYFLHVAQFGYTYEHMTAFFPGYPIISGTVAATLEDLFSFVTLSTSTWILLSCVIVSNVCFILSAIALFHLTQVVLLDRQLAFTVAKMYCFNPASIFFSSCYTESLFAFLTFSGLYLLERQFDSLSTIMFAVGSLTRSNAILVPIFYLHKAWRRYQRSRYFFGLLIRAGLACVGHIAVELHFWDSFCFPHQMPKFPDEVARYAAEMGYKQKGDAASDWCFHRLPFSYSFVQAKYWNVGLFRYWQWKQVPNFLLATPIVVLLGFFCSKNYRRLPTYCIHAAFLGAVFVLVANVQVATRLLISASPVPLWAAATSKRPNLVWAYFLIYFVVGILLHVNFFPWT